MPAIEDRQLLHVNPAEIVALAIRDKNNDTTLFRLPTLQPYKTETNDPVITGISNPGQKINEKISNYTHTSLLQLLQHRNLQIILWKMMKQIIMKISR